MADQDNSTNLRNMSTLDIPNALRSSVSCLLNTVHNKRGLLLVRPRYLHRSGAPQCPSGEVASLPVCPSLWRLQSSRKEHMIHPHVSNRHSDLFAQAHLDSLILLLGTCRGRPTQFRVLFRHLGL